MKYFRSLNIDRLWNSKTLGVLREAKDAFSVFVESRLDEVRL